MDTLSVTVTCLLNYDTSISSLSCAQVEILAQGKCHVKSSKRPTHPLLRNSMKLCPGDLIYHSVCLSVDG